MHLELDFRQRAQLELIAVYSGKSVEQVLVDTAEFLMNCEANYYPPDRSVPSQQFLPEDELAARISRLLRR